VRHRTIRSKGCLSEGTAVDVRNQLSKLVLGGTFNDGIEVIANPADRQPKTAAA
jgi:hypothetical protein